MTRRPTALTVLLTAATLVIAAAGPALAARQPDPTPIADKAVRHADLTVRNGYAHPGALQGQVAERAAADLQVLGVSADQARIDLRTGRWGTLILSRPLMPGRGNQLSWDQLAAAAPAGENAIGAAAWDAFLGWVQANRNALRVDPGELIQPGRVTTHRGGDFIQIYAPRQIGGVAVRDSYLTAVINGGNLVLFGAHNWGDVALPPAPDLTPEEAIDTVLAHVSPFAVTGTRRGPGLEYVPLARGEHDAVAVGEGLDYRLAWVVRPQIADGGLAQWEALVDALSGEVLLFEDTNHYGTATTRRVSGGVLPVSNDGTPPDGVEQAGWPMSGADVTFGGTTLFSDLGGNVATCVDGNVTSTLTGAYVDMADQCGPISLTGPGNLDFGTSGGTDCITPGSGGAGNTHASRSGFFELNQMIAQAQAHLPNNTWLQDTLTANMNIPQSCNAFWGGGTVNFYRSLAGTCSNTGELASVFDHEWGHGLDDNDALPNISSPGEGIADMYSYLRLATSCIGRGFLVGAPCGGYGDPCTVCDGVRDIDFANRVSGNPHTVTSASPGCVPGPGVTCLSCGGGPSPCGGGVHCEGAIYSEALFDLVNRDLPAQYGYDFNTSLEIAARLTYLGAGNVGTWYQCSPPFGGCAATGGYLNYLAADDDDMNIANGTPHMQAIFDAFDRHELACDTPTVTDSGCAGAPTTAPVVNGSPLDRGALLTWGAVAGATEYRIYRTDGVFGCDFGKIPVGVTTGTSFADNGLQNGREYYYTVIPIGSHDACFGPASACTTVTATAGANLAVVPNSAFYDELTGDLDGFIDNCENVRVYFGISNIGTGLNTNVRAVSVTSPSHPSTTIDFPLEYTDSLAACDTAIGWFDIRADALTTSGAVEFTVEVTSDELEAAVPGQVRTETFTLTPTEVDVQSFASRLWDFEAGLDGWTVVDPIFNRTSHGAGGAGNGTQFSVDSSTLLADQCDKIRSPFMFLEPTSTLSLWNNYDIENISNGTWYDRANVALEGNDGSRTVVNPSSGRTYNAGPGGPGSFSGCNDGEMGWAAANPTWGTSTWSAGNFGGMAPSGPVQIEVTYSTDPLLQLQGFWFDQVEVTDLSLLVADTQGNVCPVNDLVFGDGFEGGSTAVWPFVP